MAYEGAAAAGKILQGSGTSTTPTFSTATYPSTTTSQQLLYSSAANTVGGLATGNSLLAATNSSGTLAMRAFSVNIQIFTASGTYTPSTGMIVCIIECVGGGAGGGGAATTSANTVCAGGGGGAGEYAAGVFSASTIGASQTITIGAAGSGGAAGNNNGTDGSATSVGSLISANGGTHGNGSPAGGAGTGGAGGTGGSGGTIRFAGQTGGSGLALLTNSPATNYLYYGGYGGVCPFSMGGAPGLNSAGGNASGNGGGGAGAGLLPNATQQGGGNGSKGFVKITEFIIN